MPWGRLSLLLALTLLVFLIHLGWGSTRLVMPWDVLRELLRGPVRGEAANDIVWAIRLPRATTCLTVGALLGAVGAVFQALFRNPLAEPYVIGVSSGAAVGGTLALVAGLAGAWGGYGVLVCAFAGGMATLALVLTMAQKKGRIQVNTLLLAGVVLGALLSSVLTMVLLLGGRDTNVVLRWLLGSTTPAFWHMVAVQAVVLVIGFAVLYRQARSLNAFSVSEFMAERLGVNTNRLKWSVLIAGTAMTSVAVGSVGIIGFLGLVAPHISRRVIALDLRATLFGSALLGSCLLLAADAVAQRAKTGVELPVGVVTAVIGAPVLLALLRSKG